MNNAFLYIVTVLIWGSTWLAIEFQIGEVAEEISLIYRFGLSAVIMWGFCLWRSIDLRFSAANHGFAVLLALGNFSVNYMFIYKAQAHLTSAMTSIAFSSLLLLNIVNSRLFFGTKIAKRIYLGACIGVLGIVSLFWQDLRAADYSSSSLSGLVLVLIGTLIASFGNMVSLRNSKFGLNIFAANAWGMLYATLALMLFAWFNGSEYTFSSQPTYLASLLYLSVFGTVIAFASYFLLLGSMGVEKASYASVLIPVVAVTLSSFFEGFVWTPNVIAGFMMVVMGNIILLTSTAKMKRLFSALFRPKQAKSIR